MGAMISSDWISSLFVGLSDKAVGRLVGRSHHTIRSRRNGNGRWAAEDLFLAMARSEEVNARALEILDQIKGSQCP